jgi:hypothetical protein
MQRIFRRRLRTLEAAQRYSAFARTRATELGAEAALGEAELEAEQQSADPEGRRHASFWLSVLATAVFAALDAWPAWWAAEALGGPNGVWSLREGLTPGRSSRRWTGRPAASCCSPGWPCAGRRRSSRRACFRA